jgi:hypothetical protein
MKQTSNYFPESIANLFFCLLIILSINLGCTGISRPWRDYSPKPFNSQEWLAGDAIERGRMTLDIFKRRIPDGKSKEEIIKLFGEADKKVTVEGREVWLYRAENKLHNRLNQFPISFDAKKGAFTGGVRGGTISMYVDEEWANKGE